MGIKVEVVGHIQDIPCTCQLPWLAVDQLWSALAGPLLMLLVQTGVLKLPLSP